MNKYDNFPVADLKESHLSKIQTLEKELSQDTGEEIVLIAYDKED